jgi:hypothetical protein
MHQTSTTFLSFLSSTTYREKDLLLFCTLVSIPRDLGANDVVTCLRYCNSVIAMYICISNQPRISAQDFMHFIMTRLEDLTWFFCTTVLLFGLGFVQVHSARRHGGFYKVSFDSQRLLMDSAGDLRLGIQDQHLEDRHSCQYSHAVLIIKFKTLVLAKEAEPWEKLF